MDIKAELYPFGKMFEDAGIPEYVYTDPIPQDMWVSAHDCETGEQVYP